MVQKTKGSCTNSANCCNKPDANVHLETTANYCKFELAIVDCSALCTHALNTRGAALANTN